MNESKRRTCAYPGCEVVMEAAPERGGPAPRYCDSPEHNAHSVFRALQRGEGHAPPDTAARLGLAPAGDGPDAREFRPQRAGSGSHRG